MSSSMPKCKITVLKRSLNKDLIDNFISDDYTNMEPCEIFKEGQEIIIDPNIPKVPDGFCDWAWADIRNDIMIITSGGDIIGMKHKGTVITGCTDWFRPVIFKVERID